MSRLKFLLLLLVPFLPLAMTGQEVLYSPFEKFDLRTGDFTVAGKVGNKLYVYRTNKDGFYLDAYNDKMENIATILLDFFPEKIYETRFITYPNKIIVLYQSLEKGSVTQYAALLDDAGRLQGEPVTLHSTKASAFGTSRNYFSSAISANKQHILVYGTNEKGNTVYFSGKWLNSNLELTATGTSSFTAENGIEHGEAILGNDGTMYLPVFTPIGNKSFADHAWLLALKQGAGNFTPTELPLNEKFAAGTYMKLDTAKNRIYIGGFYSGKKNGNYEGVLYTYYDPSSNTFEKRKDIPFEGSQRTATGEKNAKKAFNDFQVKQLIVRNDGGFVLVAEDFFVTTRSNYASGYGYYSMYYPNMTSAVSEYHYGDIIVASYNAEGNKEWHRFIRKDQYSQEDGGVFSSYAFMNTGGTLGFMFNDFNSRNSRIQLASVDGTGQVSIHSLAAGRSDDPDWLPRSGKQVAAKEIVVPCIRKQQICFAKIVF
jgi:hypothetical protein